MMLSYVLKCFSRVDQFFARVVEGLLIVILLSMAAITLLQVILRDSFSSGIPGAELIARHMVLWIAFLGGMLATRSRQHIAVDVIVRFLPHRPRNLVRLIVDSVSCVVSYSLAKAALDFVLEEKKMGGIFLGQVPDWWVQSVIPFGFAIIALEYAIGVILDIKRMIEVGDQHTAGEWRKTIPS